MKKLLCSFFLLLSLNVTAQTAQDRIKEAIAGFDYKLALTIIEADSVHSDSEWEFQHASILKALNRYPEAIDILISIKEKEPSLRVFVELMNCSSLAGKLSESLAFCQEALKIAPKNDFLKIRKASLLFETTDYKKAYTCYDTLYIQDSTLLFLNQMGLCKEFMKQPKEAIDLYKRVLTIDSFNITAANRLLNLQIKLERYDEAYVFSESFLSRDSSNMDITKLNGLSKFFTKRYKDAIVLFDRLYTSGDSSYLVVRYLGLSYYMDQDYYAAVEHIPLALELDSNNLDLRFAMGVACSRSSYQNEAIIHLEFVRDKLMPDESFLARIYDELGEAYRRIQNWDKALENRILAAENADNEHKPISYYEVASLFQQRKNKENALVYYQKAWDSLDPSDTTEEFMGPAGIMQKTFRGNIRQQLDRLKKELYSENPAYGSLAVDSLSKN